jgi:hypothetical protein
MDMVRDLISRHGPVEGDAPRIMAEFRDLAELVTVSRRRARKEAAS